MSTEPILRKDDLEVWKTLERTAIVHSKTRSYKKHIESALEVVELAIDSSKGNMAIMWSGGKDSTAMTHLIRVLYGANIKAVSEKDDLDYPGEEEYVSKLAEHWDLDLEIIRPKSSLREWISENATNIDQTEDMHGRSAALSKEFFYNLVEKASEQYKGIFLGLRREESRGRSLNRAVHGLVYEKKNRQIVATPLGDWSGLDVIAYLISNNIEPLPVYKCVAYNPDYRQEPWRVRKSWWIPGSHSRWGGIAWLRHYYPSLYNQLIEWCPKASLYS